MRTQLLSFFAATSIAIFSALAAAGECHPTHTTEEYGFSGDALPLGNEFIAVSILNNTIVESARLEATFTTYGAFDAADVTIAVFGPSGGAFVVGTDLGWTGSGTFTGAIDLNGLNGPVYTAPNPFATWFIVITGALENEDGSAASAGGHFDAGSRVLLNHRLFPCPADLDGSGYVDFSDLNALLQAYGGGAAGDVDCDSDTDFDDLNALLSAWGVSCDCSICS